MIRHQVIHLNMTDVEFTSTQENIAFYIYSAKAKYYYNNHEFSNKCYYLRSYLVKQQHMKRGSPWTRSKSLP